MRTKDQVVKRCVYARASYYRPKVISIIIPYHCGPLFAGCATVVECLAPKRSLVSAYIPYSALIFHVYYSFKA